MTGIQPTLVIGVIALLILSFVLNTWVGRRAFYRRNAAGVEIYRNYRHMMFSSWIEGFARLIAGIAGLIGGLGLILMIMAVLNQKL